jgi:hypothetical protein
VNEADAESLDGEPTAVIVYVAGVVPDFTMKVIVPLPLLRVHVDGLLTGVPLTAQPVSDTLNPDRVTVTEVPGFPWDGFKEIVGDALTFCRNAVSAETNRAMRRISKVTAYRVRRRVSNLSTHL